MRETGTTIATNVSARSAATGTTAKVKPMDGSVKDSD
jgi:hypothetical protein